MVWVVLIRWSEMADVAEGSESPEEDFNPLEDDLNQGNSDSGDFKQDGEPYSMDYIHGSNDEVDSPVNSIDPSDLGKYAITPPTLGRAIRRAKEKCFVQGRTRNLTYREYKEQTGRSRHNYSDPGFRQAVQQPTELTGFEIGSDEQGEEGKGQRKLPAKSKSFKSFKKPRKYDRDMKNENLNAVPEGNTNNVLLTPLGQNVLPSFNVDSGRFMSLSQKFQPVQKPPGTRRQLSTPRKDCPKDRIEFSNIFSMLINMGDKAKKEKERNMSRQKSHDENFWVSQVMDYVWLELQAWHSGKSLKEMDRDIILERKKINSVLEEVINFCIVQTPDDDIEGRPTDTGSFSQGIVKPQPIRMDIVTEEGGIDIPSANGHSTSVKIDRCDNEEGVMNCDFDTSGIFLDRAIIDSQREAVIQVTDLLNQVEVLEGLYPTTKALGKECALYTSDIFKHNLDTLCLWFNITKDLSHTLNMMAKTLGMQCFDGLDWQLSEYCTTCPAAPTGHVCGDECCCIRPNEPAEVVRFQVEESPSEEDSPEAYPPHYLPKLKLGGKSVRFDSTNPSSPTDLEVMRLTPGTPSSTSTPVKFRSSPSISNMSRTSSEISLDDGQKSWRYVYRYFVEKSLKKMGMRKLLKRLHDLLDGSLQRSKVILIKKPNPSLAEVSKPSLEEDQILSSSPSMMNFVPMSPTLHPSPDNSSHGNVIKGDTTECWINDFVRMGLPSFRPSYLFLVRMPLDIVHECLRLRLEQRLALEGMDPSFLSIRQLIHECKEVLHGAMLVKQYYKQMVSVVMWDDETLEERLNETDLEEFDDDMKQMMDVYFSYIRKLMSYVQNLPDASRSLKNHLEEEWTFTKKICPHIRGGEAEAGKRFCFMASDLLGSIGDFLDCGIDQCTTTLFTRTMSEMDDESLNDSFNQSQRPPVLQTSSSFSKIHEHRQAIIYTCREFKNLFYEARERASKALGFAKMLRKDLEVAADFNITVSTEELLKKLNDTHHTMVIAPHSSGYQMFVPNSIVDDKTMVVGLLNTTCGHDFQQLPEGREENGYLLLVKCDPCVKWEGGVYKVEPTAETTIALSHIEVEGLLLVVTHSSHIGHQRRKFKAEMAECLELVNEQTSCHQAIGESLHELRIAALDLREKVAEAILQVDEKLSMDDLADKEENERISLFKLYTETLHQCYNFGFDYHKEILRLVTGDARERLSHGLLKFAKQWMNFVEEKCEKGRGTRPRWATQGFDFLTVACEPKVLCLLSEEEFQELKIKIGEIVTHIVGSAKQTPTVITTTTFRVSSPDPMSQKFLSRASSCIDTSGQQKYSRAKSTSSEPTMSSSQAMHRLSLDSAGQGSGTPRRDGERRASFDYSQALDQQDGCYMACPTDERDEADAEVEALANAKAFPMHRIHKSLKRLEEDRQDQLAQANMIGKVVSCKTEVDYHINVKRANFQWQRGMKVGDGRFGKVYTAVNLKTTELMAMKVISFQPNDHRTIKEIADEIRTFEGIHHESLVRYYGVEVHRDEIMIFMEFCDGGTIEEAAKAGLSEILVRKYTRNLLVAVNVLHEHGIVHRDIKGNNIFLTTSGDLKLGDFGCSAKLKNHTTMVGEFNNLVGTTAFMAPEVYTASDDSKGQGRAADIWSLGCVVIEMATGKKPWHDLENDFQIMFKVGSGASPTIPEYISQEGKDFLLLCLVHDPKLRARASVLLDDPFTKVFEEDTK